MKPTLLMLALGFLCSFHFGVKAQVQKANFGIYETVKNKDIPKSVIEILKAQKIQPETNLQSSMIGYLQKSANVTFPIRCEKENLKLVKTVYPVDKGGDYFGIFAVRHVPVIVNADIEETVVRGKNVEIHFNLKGARKWDEMTRKNKGGIVAFAIDDQVYTAPIIMAEINSGVAIINGLKDEAMAKKISDQLNNSIRK
ncbi:MAG: hypothetical protein Q8908_11110 [Bacteroidota bacterium]|nr:hypothetical protein [Bacteroidota bacterium]